MMSDIVSNQQLSSAENRVALHGTEPGSTVVHHTRVSDEAPVTKLCRDLEKPLVKDLTHSSTGRLLTIDLPG